MNVRKTGMLVALALAGGVVIGAAGSAIAASPVPGTSTGSPWQQMGQMMGGFAGTFGPGMMGGTGAGMMGNLDPASRAALLEQCDELHDAMHAAVGPSSAPRQQ